MIEQFKVTCRDKNTRQVSSEVCEGETEFKAIYNFCHEHQEVKVLEVRPVNDKPYLFPTFRSVCLFVTGLCVVSLVLFPIIILFIHLIHSAWLSISSH